MAKQQISVPLNEQQAAFIKERADAEDHSAASVIRRLEEQARAAQARAAAAIGRIGRREPCPSVVLDRAKRPRRELLMDGV
jgi:hypothetical protein